MKFISTLLLSFIVLSASSQRLKIITAYSLGIPKEAMEKNIQPAHALQAGVLYQLPGHLKQLSVGTELGIGIYANKRIEQTFQFDANTSSVVPVNYSSNTFNANLQARFDLIPGNNNIIPYINAKGGVYSFFSTINIEDPNDPLGCHALQNENIIHDKTLYWSAGGGLQIDPVIFSKHKHSGRTLIDISANTVRGGTLDYINTRHLKDAQTVSDPEGKPLNVQFVNASTQAIHEHTVAEVFTSPLRLLEFRLGVTIKL